MSEPKLTPAEAALVEVAELAVSTFDMLTLYGATAGQTWYDRRIGIRAALSAFLAERAASGSELVKANRGAERSAKVIDAQVKEIIRLRDRIARLEAGLRAIADRTFNKELTSAADVARKALEGE